MDKNMPKYKSYRNAYDQIKLAIDAGFFLEAITIEESILTDRLFRFCKDHGMKKPIDRATLGDVLRVLQGLPAETQDFENIDFLPSLIEFWDNRNICLHQIVKSGPGEPTIDFVEIIDRARITAISGKALTKKVSNWAQRYKIGFLKKTT